MKKGNIKQILDYYLSPEHAWMFGADIERAVRDFFEGISVEFDEESIGHFNEWFLYDFKLPTNETPLEYFYNKNPLRLQSDDLSEYKSMQENTYDIFETKEVHKEKGLSLRSLRSDKEYEVQEKAATRDLRKGDMFVCRIIKIGDHYELAGGSVFILPQMDNGAKDFLMKTTDEINPKIVFHGLISKQSNTNFKEDKIAGSKTTIVSGSFDSSLMQEDDDCAVCRLMRKTREEGRQPTKEEIERAIEETDKEGGH